MARVDYADGTQREVKNLGWLLRHSAEAEIIHLKGRVGTDGLLEVWGKGWKYTAHFASWGVAVGFISRRAFNHTICEYI